MGHLIWAGRFDFVLILKKKEFVIEWNMMFQQIIESK